MIDAKRLGLAGGILWGLVLFFVTLLSSKTGYASVFLTMLSGIYPGFEISAGGSLLGLIYGFLDGFIGLYLLITLYNTLEDCHSCDSKKKK